MYDIETEKTYFIDIAKIPYESYRRCFIIGDNVYFEKSVIKEAPTLKQKNLTTGKVKQLDISSRSFIATEESLLYWNRHESGAQSLNLYKDGSTEVLIPEDVEDITSIDTEVYWFKECESAPYEVYEYDLNNLKSSLLKFSMEHQGWIQKINMSEYLFVDQFTLYKWSNKTKSKQRLTKEGDVVDSVFYKDGMVYYKRENQTIVKLDPMTETTQICVDIELHRKMKEDVDCDAYIDSVDYCEDYIAVFLVEEIGSKYLMTLLFFDYEGNYIGQY